MWYNSNEVIDMKFITVMVYSKYDNDPGSKKVINLESICTIDLSSFRRRPDGAELYAISLNNHTESIYVLKDELNRILAAIKDYMV
jgi:hypothetical protein